MKKAVIFDLDGTLADTLESIAWCVNRTLQDMGLPAIAGQETFKQLVGNGARVLMARALRMAGDIPGPEDAQSDVDGIVVGTVRMEEAMERYTRYFEKGCMYRVRPYAGIGSLLKRLKEQGVRIAVCSNKPHANAVYVVESLFGKDYFDVVQGQLPGVPKKPAPDGVFMILEKLGLHQEDVLYVGDSGVDMDTGRAAGLKTAGVLWGFRGREELEGHGADVLVEDPGQLAECLKGGGKDARV